MLVVEETQSYKPEGFYFVLLFLILDITIHFSFFLSAALDLCCSVGALCCSVRGLL